MAKAAGNTTKIEQELATLNVQLARQNNFWRRFVMGILFGLGTAIGASLIFSFIAVGVYQAFLLVGLEGVLQGILRN